MYHHNAFTQPSFEQEYPSPDGFDETQYRQGRLSGGHAKAQFFSDAVKVYPMPVLAPATEVSGPPIQDVEKPLFDYNAATSPEREPTYAELDAIDEHMATLKRRGYSLYLIDPEDTPDDENA